MIDSRSRLNSWTIASFENPHFCASATFSVYRSVAVCIMPRPSSVRILRTRNQARCKLRYFYVVQSRHCDPPPNDRSSTRNTLILCAFQASGFHLIRPPGINVSSRLLMDFDLVLARIRWRVGVQLALSAEHPETFHL